MPEHTVVTSAGSLSVPHTHTHTHPPTQTHTWHRVHEALVMTASCPNKRKLKGQRSTKQERNNLSLCTTHTHTHTDSHAHAHTHTHTHTYTHTHTPSLKTIFSSIMLFRLLSFSVHSFDLGVHNVCLKHFFFCFPLVLFSFFIPFSPAASSKQIEASNSVK